MKSKEFTHSTHKRRNITAHYADAKQKKTPSTPSARKMHSRCVTPSKFQLRQAACNWRWLQGRSLSTIPNIREFRTTLGWQQCTPTPPTQRPPSPYNDTVNKPIRAFFIPPALLLLLLRWPMVCVCARSWKDTWMMAGQFSRQVWLDNSEISWSGMGKVRDDFGLFIYALHHRFVVTPRWLWNVCFVYL